MATYSLHKDEILCFMSNAKGFEHLRYDTNYIGRDEEGVYFSDSSKKKLYINELTSLIKELQGKKFRSEEVKKVYLQHLNSALAYIRHYRIQFMLEPKPIMNYLDVLALAC